MGKGSGLKTQIVMVKCVKRKQERKRQMDRKETLRVSWKKGPGLKTQIFMVKCVKRKQRKKETEG